MSMRLQALLALLIPASSLQASIIYVDGNATGPIHDGSSWCTAYLELQDALCHADAGDTVRVAQGIYYPDRGTNQTAGDRSATFQLETGITWEGGYAGCQAPDPDARDLITFETVLSGDLGENDAVDDPVDCCTPNSGTTGCNVDSCEAVVCESYSACCDNEWGPRCALLAQELCNETCQIDDNSLHVVTSEGADRTAILDGFHVQRGFANGQGLDVVGGGLFNHESSPTVRNCTFSRNYADSLGGAIANYLYSTSLIQNCTFVANSAWNGAGINNVGWTETAIIDCRFEENFGSRGAGAYYSSNGDGYLLNNVFVRNHASSVGGGLAVQSGSRPLVANCIFAGNRAVRGGGISIDSHSDANIVNCTVVGNRADQTGGGVTNNGSDPRISNSIVWDNSAGESSGQDVQFHLDESDPGFPIVNFSIIEGWDDTLGGVGNTGQDPMMLESSGMDGIYGTADDDFRLGDDSSAIDAGSNFLLPADALDLDGDGNLSEKMPFDALGVVRRTDIINVVDSGDGTAPVVDIGALERIHDCNGNGVDDAVDISSGLSLDCDADGILDECVLLIDCNDNGTCDAQDVANGTSPDCDGNGNPDECDPDCNGNGQNDVCDIATGISADCNGDYSPDECLDGNVDCDDNGLIDDCEVANGTTADVNTNGIPDTCEPLVIYVRQDAAGRSTGLSWADAYNTIQDAIAAADESDGLIEQVWVAAGVYRPGEESSDNLASFGLRDGLKIYAGFTGVETELHQRDPVTHLTTLSGDLRDNDSQGDEEYYIFDNVLHVVTAEDVDEFARLDGFVITDSHAGAIYDNWRGGALRSRGGAVELTEGSDAKFIACFFWENVTEGIGGAVRVDQSDPIFNSCVFVDNYADSSGGAANLQESTTLFQDCVFIGNEAEDGGAIENQDSSETTLRRCTLRGSKGYDEGGAIRIDSGHVTVEDSVLENNWTDRYGGAIYVRAPSTAMLTNSHFKGNRSDRDGGAVFVSGTLEAVGCLFEGNTTDDDGGAIFGGSLALTNCTITGNRTDESYGEGQGVFATNISKISNSIIWGNYNEDSSDELTQLAGSFDLHYSLVEGWTGGGIGNLDVDPEFVMPGFYEDSGDGASEWIAGDYRLLQDSPAIDAADGLVDIAPFNTLFDPIPLITIEGTPRFIDIADVEDTGVGPAPLPDIGAFEMVSDCNGNGDPDDLDINTGVSSDCNQNDIPDQCEADCNQSGQPDLCDIEDGTSEDCNGNGIPDDCEGDCNGNGLSDSCEIDDGSVDDCNDDGIPDDCLTPQVDCNQNGLIDDCEIDDGMAVDANNNGRPDDCEPAVLFVKRDATGWAAGTSWEDAFTDLQEAIAVAADASGFVEQIWIAKGTYTPAPPNGNRLASFDLVSGVAMYGGFAGTEDSVAERNLTLNETILSGDLNGDDVGPLIDPSRFGNATNVVDASGVDSSTILDGVTVTGGFGNSNCCGERIGAGLIMNGGSAAIRNCTFRYNTAYNIGGAMWINSGNPSISRCRFESNYALQDGGTIFLDLYSNIVIERTHFIGNRADNEGGAIFKHYYPNSTLSLVNCVFDDNYAYVAGGAIFQERSSMYVTNSIFTENDSGSGGAVFMRQFTTGFFTHCTFSMNSNAAVDFISNAMPKFDNCIIYGNSPDEFGFPTPTVPVLNYSCYGGPLSEVEGVGNISDNPMFVGPSLRLSANSPCIDAGSNLLVPADETDLDADGDVTEPLPLDLDEQERFVDVLPVPDTGEGDPPIVDMGAYELSVEPFIAKGSRYIELTPPHATDLPSSIFIDSPDLPCFGKYVDENGAFTDTAVVLNPEQWGTQTLTGEEIRPDTTYEIHVQTTDGVEAFAVTTWPWGDADDSGAVNFTDVLLAVLGFRGEFLNSSWEALDQEPCVTNRQVNLADVFANVLAFQGHEFSDQCGQPCGQ
ncbi:MAG: right-handed parallel beta-helix repeat-containing protein [Planctomycetota bacterium]|jgi:hypothetical protein